MPTIPWVSGDTAPVLPITVTTSTGGAYDLTGCTVRFRINDPDTNTETNSNSNNSCVITSATGGTVTYQWNATDTPSAKAYTADLEITTSGGKVSTPFAQIVIAVRAKN